MTQHLPEQHTAEAGKSGLEPTAHPLTEKFAFSLHEVCQILGVCAVTVWRLEKRGRLRSVPGLRCKIYPRAEIERFLKLPKVGGAA